MGDGGMWSAVGTVLAATVGGLAMVAAGMVAARATTSAARTSAEAQAAVQLDKDQRVRDLEGLVRALARAYDELRVWARNPHGDPPEPNERVREFYRTGG